MKHFKVYKLKKKQKQNWETVSYPKKKRENTQIQEYKNNKGLS